MMPIQSVMKAKPQDRTIDTARLDDRSRIPLPKLVKEELGLEAATKEAPGSLVIFKVNAQGQVYIEKLP